jgi:hypothetical protein
MARTRLFSLAEPHLKINVINTVRKENKSSIVSGSTSNSRAEKVSRKRKSEKKKEKIQAVHTIIQVQVHGAEQNGGLKTSDLGSLLKHSRQHVSMSAWPHRPPACRERAAHVSYSWGCLGCLGGGATEHHLEGNNYCTRSSCRRTPKTRAVPIQSFNTQPQYPRGSLVRPPPARTPSSAATRPTLARNSPLCSLHCAPSSAAFPHSPTADLSLAGARS